MVHTLDAVDTPPAPAVVAGGPAGRALAFINQAIVLLSSIALVVASFVLTYSVAGRYFLHLSTDWQDELSVFLIVGAVFMSSAAIQERRGHVAIEAITGLLPAGVNRVRQILVDAACLTFCAFFAWKSWLLLDEAWTENFHSESTWGPPLWIPYSLMTVGMTLLSVQLLMQIVVALERAKVRAMTTATIGLLCGAATLLAMFAGMPIGFALGAMATVFMIVLLLMQIAVALAPRKSAE